LTCQELIASEIPPEGSISFARFMELALYAPGVGYYSSGSQRVGRGGDFYTSASVGSAFGKILAALFEEMWTTLGRPDKFVVVEQGADMGRLAEDVLAAVSPGFSTALHYIIVEPSSRLKDIQKSLLASREELISWYECLEDLPDFEGVHFSNELVDAMPFHILCSNGSGWNEMRVGHHSSGFAFVERGLPDSLAPATKQLPMRPAGYLTEVRPAAQTWIAQVAKRLKRGYVLVMDYGLTREQLLQEDRVRGTFLSFRAHRKDEKVLENPGQKDLTAHVDFTALAEAGQKAGLAGAGFCDQHHFLVGAATPLLKQLDGLPPTVANTKFLRALKSLMHPETMGTQFFAFCMSAGLSGKGPLSAFREGVAGFNKVLP
jgi:SAM-dependent MidA family methyltransferase